MEKRALIAAVLSIAVLVIWQFFFALPVPAPGAPVTTTAESSRPPAVPGATVPPAATEGASAPIAAAAKEEFRLITATQDIRMTNEGGRITWWRLKKYTVEKDIPVDLIPEQARAAGFLPLQIEVANEPELTRTLATALHVHEMTDIPAYDRSGLGPGKRIAFTYADGRGLVVKKSLDVPEDGYLGRLSFEITRDGKPLAATIISASGLTEQLGEEAGFNGQVEGEAVLHDGSEVLRMPAAKVAEMRVYSASNGTPLRWGGLESTYFASLLLPPEGDRELAVTLTPRHTAPPTDGRKVTPLITAGASATGGGVYRIFVGPKDYALLHSLGHELDRVIDFSRISLIYVCTKYLFLALTWLNGYVGNYGWSIIILTFVVRLVFFPIMYRSSITMRQTSKKMTKIQPRVKSIQERYRKMKKSMETNRQMNEEVMALYKKEGVNPMANLRGCLPLLLQMPIFIGFYNMLAVTIEMRQAPFMLWLHDLSRRDPYYVTPVLMGASWVLQQLMTSSSIPDPMQRKMMMLMPIIFTFFMMNMPSGLVIYWLTSNVLGMAQQFLTNKRADQLDAEAKA